MSTLQDFAKLQLQPPGELQPQAVPSAPPMDPVASAPVDQIPVNQGGSPPLPVPNPNAGPIAPSVVDAAAQELEPPPQHLSTLLQIDHAASVNEHDARIQRDKALVAQTKANDDIAQVAADRAMAQQPVLSRELQLQNDHAKQMEQQQAVQHAAAVAHAEDYGKTIDEVSTKLANQPKDIWGATGVNKVSGIIGLILGGLAGSSNGGKNVAVERLDKLREQNLAQQKFEYEMLRGKADMKNNQYAMFRNMGLDDAAASNAAYAVKTASIQTQLGMVENQYAPQAAKAAAAQVNAHLQAQHDDAVNKGKQQLYQNAFKNYSLQQKDQEIANRREFLQLRAAAAPNVYSSPVTGDIILPDNFPKENKATIQRFQIQLQALKEAAAQVRQYKGTSALEPGKRAGLRKGVPASLATADVGNARVSEARVKAAEHETGADPLVHLPFLGDFGQKGMLSTDIDGRMEQALRTRLEVMANSIKAAGGTVRPDGELARLLRDYHVDIEHQSLGTNPDQAHGTLQQHANDTLDRFNK